MNSYSYGRNNPLRYSDNGGNGVVDKVVFNTFRWLFRADDATDIANSSLDMYSVYGEPGAPESAHVDAGGNLGWDLVQLLPSLTPAAFPMMLWDGFIFTGEMMGLDPKDAPQHVENMKERLRKENIIPGLQFQSTSASGAKSQPIVGQQNTQRTNNSSAGNTVYVQGSNLPRSKDPVGSSGGQPVYCWGSCGN
ncbi:MAG: hypothetical protein UY63_C0008G0007 [Parcubacteria group bacterium GW2011_GWA2_51_10]|nr:MAG: hypothetical protein UY63_C0008G0007 [Parcubacteria group bacterium GW2011_GWA2_51_10]